MKFALLSFLFFGIGLLGCGTGNPKIHLTPEEGIQLKNASKVFLVHYQSPDFFIWTGSSNLPRAIAGGLLSGALGGGFVGSGVMVKESWDNFRIQMNLQFFPHDITEKMKQKFLEVLRKNYHFSNVTPISFQDEVSLMNLRENLGNDKSKNNKVIDIKTYFWHLSPTYEKNKNNFQFQYRGEVRVINLQPLSVILQHQCQYPAHSRGDLILIPEGPSMLSGPVWEDSMTMPELITNNGEKIQTQIDKAVDHCLKEFTDKFFHEINDLSSSSPN
ncbi:MAG TPA: hypothetical protein PKM72_09560 [Nitrospirales bacterium]|nr:hypothetical protein [Nitrospirales bacterium]